MPRAHAQHALMTDESPPSPDRSVVWAITALVWPILGTLAGAGLAVALQSDPHHGQVMIFGGLIGLAIGSIACAVQISLSRSPDRG